MRYRFFSRQDGWRDGSPVKFFYTSEIDDKDNLTKDFVDLSGRQILKKIKNNKELTTLLFDLTTTYYDWYYYEHDRQLTEQRLFI